MIFACVLLLAAVVTAEPPRYRQGFRSQRQEVEVTAAEAPYAPAGFKPSREFALPSRQEFAPPTTNYGVPSRQENIPPATNYGVPDNSYGAPFNTYLTPQTEYGLPDDKETTTVKPDDNVEAKTEATKENLELEPKKDAEVINSEGAYYVLLPGSQLQRVQFQTENDLRNMAYTARLQYKDADRAPLFVYTAVPQYQSAAYFQLFK
ncbi:uncharacterized protein LOC112044162 [Bicyclus anynana]|uniref:Uncharacterized protein LOC112044162 n=1 Tax=Bicyclus anynana TaxID=110368 RepID=A0A6J1MS10_BICAN|nr:uncharacterized protein LOC112044162 [Bicyclus anynana]